jgi:hypothetical protein
MAKDAEGNDIANADEGIGGTPFKTPEELASGYLNLQKKFGEQGNELGTVKKDHESLKGQTETLANLLKENLGKGGGDKKGTAKEEPTVDYGTELAAVEKQIQELDPMADGYQKTLAGLVSKTNKLTAQQTKEEVLKATHGVMTKELGERDVKAAHQKFFDANPTFNTPEMQQKIKEYIAKDPSGMSDSLSAFREIQRDEALAQSKQLSDENTEYKKRLDLAKGTEETGKVIVKGQPPAPSNKPKATGKDLDAGMKAALENLRT